MPAIETVLFDLDGTLIDSVDLIVDSFLHTFAVHQLPALSREEILAGIGTPLRVAFGKMTDDADILDAWIATYRDYNIANHDSQVVAYPGTIEMVRRLHAKGLRLGLVTSKNRVGAFRGLDLVDLREVMDVVVGADDVEHPKPHPEPVLKALAQLGMPAESALFVGDSHHDIHCGRAAGVQTVGVTWGPFDRAHLAKASPDHYCDTPEQLLRLAGA